MKGFSVWYRRILVFLPKAINIPEAILHSFPSCTVNEITIYITTTREEKETHKVLISYEESLGSLVNGWSPGETKRLLATNRWPKSLWTLGTRLVKFLNILAAETDETNVLFNIQGVTFSLQEHFQVSSLANLHMTTQKKSTKKKFHWSW